MRGVLRTSYVLAVATLAGAGFTGGSPPLTLVAIVLALPAALVAVPVYYVTYGLVAQLPGANPSVSSGSGFCTAGGDCGESVTSGAADWFVVVTDALGICALIAAAVVNVVLLRRVTTRPDAQRADA